jgi:hypothetical protein
MIIFRDLLKKVFNDYSDFSDLVSIDFFDRSARMKELHRQGRYLGTSRIGEWNRSDEKRTRMKLIRERNAIDKSSTGYGSERKMRLDNKNLLLTQYSGQPGFLYFLDFPTLNSVKIGFSKNWEFRTTYQLVSKKSNTEEDILMIISGVTEDLAEIEYNALLKFQEHTILDPTGTRYTEYLSRDIKADIYKYLEDEVRKNPKLKFEIKNPL